MPKARRQHEPQKLGPQSIAVSPATDPWPSGRRLGMLILRAREMNGAKAVSHLKAHTHMKRLKGGHLAMSKSQLFYLEAGTVLPPNVLDAAPTYELLAQWMKFAGLGSRLLPVLMRVAAIENILDELDAQADLRGAMAEELERAVPAWKKTLEDVLDTPVSEAEDADLVHLRLFGKRTGYPSLLPILMFGWARIRDHRAAQRSTTLLLGRKWRRPRNGIASARGAVKDWLTQDPLVALNIRAWLDEAFIADVADLWIHLNLKLLVGEEHGALRVRARASHRRTPR